MKILQEKGDHKFLKAGKGKNFVSNALHSNEDSKEVFSFPPQDLVVRTSIIKTYNTDAEGNKTLKEEKEINYFEAKCFNSNNLLTKVSLGSLNEVFAIGKEVTKFPGYKEYLAAAKPLVNQSIVVSNILEEKPKNCVENQDTPIDDEDAEYVSYSINSAVRLVVVKDAKRLEVFKPIFNPTVPEITLDTDKPILTFQYKVEKIEGDALVNLDKLVNELNENSKLTKEILDSRDEEEEEED